MLSMIINTQTDMFLYCPTSNKKSQVRPPLPNILLMQLIEQAREQEKRFDEWLKYSVKAMHKEKSKNLFCQRDSPPCWVFKLREFNEWLDGKITDQAKTLWLSGTAGFGNLY